MEDKSVEDCPICLNLIHHLTIIPACHHRFCYECITSWAKSKLNCPLCKAAFEQVEHQASPSGPRTLESLPPPVIPIVDTTQPDLECLTDSYFLIEISRLIFSAERLKRDFSATSLKTRDTYGTNKLLDVLSRLYEQRNFFEREINDDPHKKFSPVEVLSELYKVESILQLLKSGRIDDLIAAFPEGVDGEEVRRYGVDDYELLEKEEKLPVKENLISSGKKLKKKKKAKQYYDDDEEYYYY
uniref:RING-type domain-containing protein n=1 Tax=Arcella intermedia TaxID=1963864 RepID=A0A6B2LG93_9EUKA|eukprot:TRINITY_DN1306_c0_g1_i1.p1 TRINITY_DN1306_c0_g1~~TRINITY_DN1306_c0_g1_i1.p1  ORF type:complete len:242 (+),score=61.24 TRINITY_DN1306_c0_g1_i1:149-874(+)